MALVLVAGAATRGSKRWIDLGFFRFQPSEFGKVLFALFLAGFLADRGEAARTSSRTPLQAIGLAAGADPARLHAARHRHGARLRGRARRRALRRRASAGCTSPSIGARRADRRRWPCSGCCPRPASTCSSRTRPHRLTGFTHPTHDPRGATYNIDAVDHRGRRGRAARPRRRRATQTRLDYLPEHATDFAFASLAEQRGFLGASILLLLYLLVVWRGLRIVDGARDLFGAIVAGGIVFAFLFQVFVNVGMTIGIAPITGIPLPFVSVGGSSMISEPRRDGILQAIHARGRRRRA